MTYQSNQSSYATLPPAWRSCARTGMQKLLGGFAGEVSHVWSIDLDEEFKPTYFVAEDNGRNDTDGSSCEAPVD